MRPNIPESPEPSLSIEDQVLLCAAHPRLSPERRDRLRHLLASPLDWPGILEQADRHGIVPLLYDHLQGMPDAGIPEAALTELAHRSRKRLVWNLCLHREQVSLLGEFNRTGIPVMPLKGFLLADMLYGDLALRPMCDIDLLVRPEDLAKGEQALLRSGYIRLHQPEVEVDLYHYSYTKDGEGGANVLVELHWDLAKSHAARLDVREVWRSASRGTWEGQEIWTMALPDLFLYLCLHAVKDGLGSLRLLVDIALTIERFGKILPWEELVGKIRAAQIRMPVYLSLLQGREFLGAPVPVEFLAAIRPARGIGWFLGQALFTWRGGLLHTPNALLEGPMMTLLMFLWEDSLRGKLRHLRRNLYPSASLRARWISLPPSSSVFRWYPVLLWQVCSQLIRQFAVRSRSRSTGPRQG